MREELLLMENLEVNRGGYPSKRTAKIRKHIMLIINKWSVWSTTLYDTLENIHSLHFYKCSRWTIKTICGGVIYLRNNLPRVLPFRI